jgi:membrane protein YqaA with SNARE-associated domain
MFHFVRVYLALFPLQQKLHTFLEWMKTFGVGGVFALTLLDSAFVPTAGAPDALLLYLAANGQAFFAAAAAVVGSTLGCLVLYYISRAAGEAALGKFSSSKRNRAKLLLDKYDVLAVLISAILPPPFPFKIFVISAGVFRLRVKRFVAAIFIGRAFRYGLLAALAFKYGDQAKDIFKQHYPTIGLGLALALIIGLVIYTLIKRRRQPDISAGLEPVQAEAD